jgi:hypothetical protein
MGTPTVTPRGAPTNPGGLAGRVTVLRYVLRYLTWTRATLLLPQDANPYTNYSNIKNLALDVY